MPKRTFPVAALLALIPVFLSSIAAAKDPPTNQLSDNQLSNNQLSNKERKEGWELLFDGKTVAQWRGYRKKDTGGGRWQAKDGCLAVPANDGQDTRGARDIVSTKAYENFELVWEWRISPGGNSGLKYLVSEDRPAAIGHEYQIIDDDKHPDAKLRDSRRTGSFYDVLPAPTAKTRPVGELNQSRVLVQGNHVEHWLNGAKIPRIRARLGWAPHRHRGEQIQGHGWFRQGEVWPHPPAGPR